MYIHVRNSDVRFQLVEVSNEQICHWTAEAVERHLPAPGGLITPLQCFAITQVSCWIDHSSIQTHRRTTEGVSVQSKQPNPDSFVLVFFLPCELYAKNCKRTINTKDFADCLQVVIRSPLLQ